MPAETPLEQQSDSEIETEIQRIVKARQLSGFDSTDAAMRLADRLDGAGSIECSPSIRREP